MAFLGAGSQIIFFPIVFDAAFFENYFTINISLFLAIGLAYVLILVVSHFHIKSTQVELDNRHGAKAVMLMIFASAFPVVVAIILFFIPSEFRVTFSSWTLVSFTKYNDENFHLAYYTPDYSEGVFDYYLYACDSHDWLCQEIYQESAFALSEHVGNFDIEDPRLVPDPASHTITLQINGEAVYVHPVK